LLINHPPPLSFIHDTLIAVRTALYASRAADTDACSGMNRSIRGKQVVVIAPRNAHAVTDLRTEVS
jgi:hypothetical protein